MIVDTSAIIGIALAEPESDQLAAAIRAADQAMVSAATLLEIYVVAHNRNRYWLRKHVADLLDSLPIEIVPLSELQAWLAVEAHRQFGRGSGHPARLNFGDCFAYALAKETGQPLLCKGDDFIHTDLELALKPA